MTLTRRPACFSARREETFKIRTKNKETDKNGASWAHESSVENKKYERDDFKYTFAVERADSGTRALDFVTRLAVLSFLLKKRRAKRKGLGSIDPTTNIQVDDSPQCKELWYNFLHNFTLHGFRYVFEKGALVRRVLWLLVLLIAIGAVCIQTERSIRKFFSRPITTTVGLEYSNEIVFPAVTLCNFNFFPHYLINGTIGEKVVSILAPPDVVKSHQENILISPYTENIMDYRSHIPHPNKGDDGDDDDDDDDDDDEEISLDAADNDIYRIMRYSEAVSFKASTNQAVSPKLANILGNKYGDAQKRQNGPQNQVDNTFNFADFVKKHGHRIGHMIKHCHWKAGKCGPHNFTSVLTNFGLCHTFNSGRPGYPLLKVHRAGVDFGLRLQLNVQQDQYYGIFRDSSGFKVMIHDQNEPPLINELGFAIHPGMHTFCGVRKTRIINLPKPWNTACEEKRSDSPRRYTKAACLLKCRAEYIVRTCRCRSFEYEGETPLCLPQQIRDCVRPSVAAFMNESDHCQCPIPCEIIKFQPQLSYAQLPAKHFSEALAKIKHIDKHQMRHYLRDNLVELDVYFEEMSTQVIQQVPAYDEESLFGDIGGQVGLFLGASILTILEVIDLVGRVLVVKLRRTQQHLV